MPSVENHSTSSSKLRGDRRVFQNRVAFDPMRYKGDEDKLPQTVITVATSLCCRRCQLIIRWKMAYAKYPSFSNIKHSKRACNACQQRCVSIPFHHVCQSCAAEHAICAKCTKTPAHSEAGSQDARRVAERARGEDDEDDEEEEDSDDSDGDGDGANPSAKQLKKLAEDDESGEGDDEEEEEEEPFPELERLNGLDVSVLRTKLRAARNASNMQQLRGQGRMRERDRRTVQRKMKTGSGQAALAAVLGRDAPVSGSDEDDDDMAEGGGGARGAKPTTAPKRTPVAMKQAAATSSDEETI